MTASDVRGEILDYLELHLAGPVGGSDEQIPDRPDKRYTVGILFPKHARQLEALKEDIDDGGGSLRDELLDDPVVLANQWLPSSIGITFFTIGTDAVEISIEGASYAKAPDASDRLWCRTPLADRRNPQVHRVDLPKTSGRLAGIQVLDGRAILDVNVRTIAGGRLVTASVVNAKELPDDHAPEPEDCLFQVRLRCFATNGAIREYPRLEFLTADPEEEELFVLYRRERAFALGHGCGADWDAEPEADSAASVWTDLVPRHEVPGTVARAPGTDRFLQLATLSDPAVPTDELAAGLARLARSYRDWIEGLPQHHTDIPPALADARDRLLARMARAHERIQAGIDLLESDPSALRAFRLANLAMLMQMEHSRRGRDALRAGLDGYREATGHSWYPFQIAFFLIILPSLMSDTSPDRDVVDLIWFPTGGGKTEAYLLASAFEIFRRRLVAGDRGSGTAVITRYTLRLLTTQQFQRAAALVCACEAIRAQDPSSLGSAPVEIGLWVGSEAFPNTFAEGREWLAKVEAGGDERLPIERCPWCWTPIIDAEAEAEDASRQIGVRSSNVAFDVYCPSRECRFHRRLPVRMVDEDIYLNPPAILIGTVDKFARLAWVEDAGGLFGDDLRKAPSLIIQDELHLISGPLGTTVGVYEAAIESLLQLYGSRPKVIASTATIRRSQDQALGVFGRDVALFPPAGLVASDSYFARQDNGRPGRVYAGVMSQSHTPSTTIIRVAGHLSQAPVELGLSGDVRDAYWTQVVYNNSLRELGKVVTYARDDIPAWIEVVAEDEARRRRLPDDEVVELTSNVPSRQIPEILTRLGTSADKPGAISLLLATNMIQVGIDVPRLGLMLVNGQPKTTSEFIQATSRIGRGAVPGLVVTMYSPSKARDRSHYESFAAYHHALYRHVEPSSVTPMALPSRERALHAALVILVRHGAGLRRNKDAGRFDPSDAAVSRAIDVLKAWCIRVDPSEAAATEEHIDRLVHHWAYRASTLRDVAIPLHYYVAGRQHERLMRNFGEAGTLNEWETLQSMRSVDAQAPVDVIGGFSGG